MKNFIEVTELKKVFGTGEDEVHAFGLATININSGEFVSVLGPSGCGKSTLMLMVAGLLDSTSGKVEFENKLVNGPKTDIGIMFQDNTLNNIENKYNLAIKLFQSEKYNESEQVILELLEIVSDNSDIYNFYGRLKQFQGQFDKSIELLKKSVMISNSNFMAHYNLGLAYCIKKDLKNVLDY